LHCVLQPDPTGEPPVTTTCRSLATALWGSALRERHKIRNLHHHAGHDPTQLSRDLGLFEGNTPQEYIRAVVHYAGAAHRLDWPATKWAVKSKGFVPAEWTKFLTPPAP
jgi:hypothetical protein